ncbi:MAG: LuxR C-terminal-related transcriptional regulator [Chloroflexota bacterium]
MSIPILNTKLYIPPPRPHAVSRPRLHKQLTAGLHCKLTLISAPAGFGKTTVLSAWVATCTQPVAWLSLDEEHNDSTRFLVYLVAALRTITLTEPQLGEGILRALQSPPPLNAMLTSLVNELTTVSQDFILVLDDYHLIQSPAVEESLHFLVQHLPPSMHLVIATRIDPSLPLARLRARGQLTELRAHDLRFTPNEAAEFLNQAMGLTLSVDEITALEDRTEGWIAGLQLAALSLQGHPDTTDFIHSFSGSHHFVLDYLVEEVLHQQPEHIQHFLRCTSILGRLCGALCDTLLPDADTAGQEVLAYLERTNLLLVPLDDQRTWYRYHHLFADALQTRLHKGPLDDVAVLHRRACAWYEQNGFRADAIHHALAARDFERAADLIELEWLATSETFFQNDTWTGWVQMLPDELIRGRMTLSLGLAWALLFSGELQSAADRLRDAERLSSSASDPNDETHRWQQALLAVAWAFHAQALGDNAATIHHARQALTLLPEANHYIAGLAGSMLGIAYWADGELVMAAKHMAEAVACLRATGHFLFAISSTYALGGIKIAQGHLFDAANLYKETLQFMVTRNEPILPGIAELHLGLSQLYHEQGNVEAARQHLLQSETFGAQAALPEWPYGLYLAQAQLKTAQGQLDDALKLLEASEPLYYPGPMPNVAPVAALKTRVWLQQGRLAEALRWVRERGLSVDDDLRYVQELEHITLVRVLITRYRLEQTDEDIQQAMTLLARLFSAAEAGGRVGRMVEILTLQALTHQAQGNPSAARPLLEQALTLAETEGYLRIFVNEGQPMRQLLDAALAHKIRPHYVQRVLAAFPNQKVTHPKSVNPATQASPLIEPLSKREIEVLHLIADGLTNQGIANTLVLSLNTVKVHTRNIYGKLDAHHRADAVAKARAVGILG